MSYFYIIFIETIKEENEIEMFNKNITKKKLSQLAKLLEIREIVNKFGIINGNLNLITKKIFNAVKFSKELINSLYFINISLSKSATIGLKELISACSNIKNFKIENIKFSNWQDFVRNSFEYVLRNLKNSCKTLTKIEIIAILLDNENLKILSDIFNKCHNLQTINISNNLFDEIVTFDYLVAFQNCLNSIEVIKLIDIYFDDESFNNLGFLLEKTRKITKFKLCFNELITEKTVIKIFDTLRKSKNYLTQISIYNLNINCMGIGKKIGELLIECQFLVRVSLKYIEFIYGFDEVCKGFKSSSECLKFLSFDNCSIQPNDIIYFNQHLRKCENIRTTIGNFSDLNGNELNNN